MCGICIILGIVRSGTKPSYGERHEQVQAADIPHKDEILSSRLMHRGPDIQNIISHQLNTHVQATLCGCTLHFRGEPTPQPLVDEQGNILLWNGEIFGGINLEDQNDGQTLLCQLQKSASPSAILSIFSKIQGPWGMVYYQASTQTLWFGRDIFGRRSLLIHLSEDNNTLALSSVKLKHLTPWLELPAKGIYAIDCTADEDLPTLPNTITLFPWTPIDEVINVNGDLDVIDNLHYKEQYQLTLGPNLISFTHGQYSIVSRITTFNRDLHEAPPSESFSQDATAGNPEGDIMAVASEEQKELADKLISVLGEAVRVRVQEQADVCDMCIKKRLQSPTRDFGSDPTIGANISNGTAKRSKEIPTGGSIGCGHARVAVLFSGGIDSLVLTALADRFVPEGEPIDLLNVAFEQKRNPAPKSMKKGGKGDAEDSVPQAISSYEVPDRITGRDGARLLNPNRPWNFIEVNVTAEDLQQARADHVQELVYPLQTVLDDSIGCAIWFAARGRGELVSVNKDDTERQPYCSTARVVLVGMGADEQLAGYSRHRVKYNTAGMQGLVDEINMEINRISARNLGRDDRIITDHGKEARFPFLDENVVSFLNALPVWKKADLRLPRGIGEKLLLRIAAVKLRLGPSAGLPKRAIQFGSRIAKLENSKEKASDICARLQQL